MVYNAPMGKTMGELIRQKRAGRSPTDIAAQIGVSENTIYRWERGERVPRGGALIRLADALGVDPHDLLGGSGIQRDRLSPTLEVGKSLGELTKEVKELRRRLDCLESARPKTEKRRPKAASN